jgi:hypothetical protein
LFSDAADSNSTDQELRSYENPSQIRAGRQQAVVVSDVKEHMTSTTRLAIKGMVILSLVEEVFVVGE